VTGDLISRRRGLSELDRLLEQLGHPYVVLGNHDFGDARDPFSQPVEITSLAHGTLLGEEPVELELRGRRVELFGIDPRTWAAKRRRPLDFGSSDADLRILLCHFPRVLQQVPHGRFHLVLAGHYHAGQIVVPYGFGKVPLAHPKATYMSGLYRRGTTVMHLSPGLGTTFVPFRFFARPEATELTLRRMA
jgi:predicted MPP superfamily phosphohydrolase